jgi:arsenate reductase
MKPKVLFLCTGNSARSQMAEGYLRHVADDRFQAMSAGIAPKGLNPLAVEAMAEIGVDISKQTSKDLLCAYRLDEGLWRKLAFQIKRVP